MCTVTYPVFTLNKSSATAAMADRGVARLEDILKQTTVDILIWSCSLQFFANFGGRH